MELVDDALPLDAEVPGWCRPAVTASLPRSRRGRGPAWPGSFVQGMSRSKCRARREVLDELEGPALAALHPGGPGLDRPVADGAGGVGDDEVGVHLRPGPEALAVGAEAERRVEGEVLRCELAEGETAGVAGALLGEEPVVLLYPSGSMPGPTFCSFSASATMRVPSPSFRAVSTESVRRERMSSFTTSRSTTSSMSCFSFLSRRSRSVRGWIIPSTRDAREAALLHVAEEVLVLALPVLDEGGEEDDAGARGELEDLPRRSAARSACRPARPQEGQCCTPMEA